MKTECPECGKRFENSQELIENHINQCFNTTGKWVKWVVKKSRNGYYLKPESEGFDNGNTIVSVMFPPYTTEFPIIKRETKYGLPRLIYTLEQVRDKWIGKFVKKRAESREENGEVGATQVARYQNRVYSIQVLIGKLYAEDGREYNQLFEVEPSFLSKAVDDVLREITTLENQIVNAQRNIEEEEINVFQLSDWELELEKSKEKLKKV